MSKNSTRGKNSRAVSPQKLCVPKISRRYLADFFGLSPRSLLFAITETVDDDGSVNISPIIAISGKQDYISLKDGVIKTNARALGEKQDLYPAIVFYNKERDEFIFKSPVNSTATVGLNALTHHFGQGVVD